MGKSPSRRAEQDVDPATARLAEAIDNLIALVLQRQGEAFWHGVELTPPQRIALRIVVDHGPLRLLEVAHRLDSTASKASRTVASLRDLGLLETEPDPEDGRAIQIVATAPTPIPPIANALPTSSASSSLCWSGIPGAPERLSALRCPV